MSNPLTLPLESMRRLQSGRGVSPRDRILGLLFGAWLMQAAPVYGAGGPSDSALQLAYCLGIYTAMSTDIEEASLHDCAPDAPPMVVSMCKSERESLPVARRTKSRLRDYLTAKRVRASDPSMLVATKRGELDYGLTIGADRACVRQLANQSGAPCADASEDALKRLNKCPSIVNALPF